MLTSFLFPSSQRSECQAREAKWCLVCLFMFCFAEIRSHCVVIQTQSHPPPASASSVLEGQAGTATPDREVTFHWHTFLNPQLVIFTSDSPVALQYRQAIVFALNKTVRSQGVEGVVYLRALLGLLAQHLSRPTRAWL